MIKAFLFSALLLLALAVQAQDSHYWSNGYSPGGILTPGAVIVNNRDSGVVFLNPALLANLTKNAISIGGNLYQYRAIKIKNGIGTGKDLSSKNSGIIPQMASGSIRIKGNKPFTISYVLLHDNKLNYTAAQQKNETFNVLADDYSPGPEIFSGQYSAHNRVNSTSAQVSLGFKASTNLSVGISAEIDHRNQYYEVNSTNKALINVPDQNGLPPFTHIQELYTASYNHLGLRFKAGFAYEANRHHFGLMVTSPMVRTYGKGSISSDFIISNLKLTPSVPDLNLLGNSHQKNLKANWKMPLSLAFGYAYDYGRGQFSITTEYFDGVGEYNNITPDDDYFIKGNAGSDLYNTSLLKLKDVRKAIFNYGLGVTYLVNPKLTAYLSLRSDMSYAKPSSFSDEWGYQNYTTNWNMVRGQIGANIKRSKFNLRTGLLLGYGHTKNFMQPLNLDDPSEGNVLAGNIHHTTASQFSAGFLLAYIHNF